MASPLGSPLNDVDKESYPQRSPSSIDEDDFDRVQTVDTDDFLSFKGHTQNDHRDMMRMGKNQEFAVRLLYLYITRFSVYCNSRLPLQVICVI